MVEVDEDTSVYETITFAARSVWTGARTCMIPWRDVIDQVGFEKLVSARGIGNDDTVVLYGGNNNWFAAYAHWYFKLYGHRDVRLLDGGRKKWELEGRELVADAPERQPSAYVAAPLDWTLRAGRDEVIASIGSRDIVDVRSPDEFSGRILAPASFPQELPQVRGHVPTAVKARGRRRLPRTAASGRTRSCARCTPDSGAGVALRDRETIVYCRIGERSAHTWFVLHELLGVPDVQNYDGSWVEYGSLVGAPVER